MPPPAQCYASIRDRLDYRFGVQLRTGFRVRGLQRSSTWGRNPSRATSTAGARMLARPPAPGHSRDPKPSQTDAGVIHHSHMSALSFTASHTTLEVSPVALIGFGNRSRDRALRSNYARAAGVQQPWGRVIAALRGGGLRAPGGWKPRCGQRAPGARRAARWRCAAHLPPAGRPPRRAPREPRTRKYTENSRLL